MAQSIIIIGAGIAGLSAGCYGQMNGYDTRIFEMHDKPGGLCTAWKRKGYTFDGCIDWLVGSRPGSPSNRVWRELGALQGKEIVDHKEFFRVQDSDGKTLILYTDVDELEQHMKALAPEDAKTIEHFCGLVRRFSRFGETMGDADQDAGFLARIGSGLKMLPFMPALMRYSKLSVQDYATRFRDPFLRKAFGATFSAPGFPLIALVFTLAWMNNRDAGYPIGGSLPFAQAIADRYVALGGALNYESRVERILVEDDRAVGVRLTDGTEHRADVVISAADGHATIFDMLEGKYMDDAIRERYETWPIFKPLVQVSLGIACDLSDRPHMISYLLDEPLVIGGEQQEQIGIKHYCYDPTLAPEGKSVITSMFNANYDYWKDLAGEPERYEAEKTDAAIKVMDHLERHLPGIQEQIEVVDVATPLTTERYTGNWRGSIEGWLPTTGNAQVSLARSLEKTLPGLENFYMVGQWVEPGGGLPPSALSGRSVIEMLCKKDGKSFEVRLP